MRWKNLALFILMFGMGYSLFQINISLFDTSSKKSKTIYDRKYEKLIELRKRFNPNSPDGIRIAEQIKKMRRLIAGYVKPDKPDEFYRILNEMKIPYGEKYSSYPPNYKMIELEKAKQKSLAKYNPLPWMERGPGNVSGRVRGLVVDPDDPSGNTWFIGSVGGGIWKTTDAGLQWVDLAPDLPHLPVSALAMASSNHNIMYAGTGESMFSVDVINGNGIYKSTNKGQSWFHLSSTIDNLDFNNISRIIVNPDDANVVIASTSSGRYRLAFANKSGIFKSTDGGNSWKEVYNETLIGGLGRVKKVLQVVATPGDFNVLYAAIDEGGILKSTDAGETWFKSNKGITDSSGRFEIAISPINSNKIFAAAEGSPTSNLFVSTDAGQNWVKTIESGTEPDWLSSQGWYDNTITVHPTDDNIVFVGGVYLYQITLGTGNSRVTTELETGPVHVDHHNLLIIPGTNGNFRILNANDGGIGLSSINATGWSKPTNGLNTTQFYGVDKMPGGSAYIGGMQDNGTWRSLENPIKTSNWIYQIGGDGYETSWHFDDPDKMIGGYQYNGIQRSTDGGQSWSAATNGLTNIGSSSAPFITKIAKTNQEPDLLFAVGSSGVFRTTNFGANWTLTPISTNWGPLSSFLDVEISRANSNIVWAGARMDPTGNIFVSNDKGLSFSPVSVYNTITMGGISGIATHPIQDSTAYILFSFARKPKILRTTNLGQSWQDISGFESSIVSMNGFPDVAVYDLIVMPHAPNTIWAGTEIGLFESTDNGGSWHAANNGLPALPIWDITYVEDEIVLGTHGRGVWSVKIPELGNAGVYKPLLKNLTQGPDGNVSINLRLRSLYDSSVVYVNENRFSKIGKTMIANQDTSVKYPVLSSQLISVDVRSYKNGVEYKSVQKNLNTIVIMPAQNSYVNNFNSLNSAFVGTGFQIKTHSGFANAAIHSNHPYLDNTNYTYTLTVPIIVASSNAYLAYKDISIVEPGDPGSVFGDENFWDYVVVEATKDGLNWIQLEDGYDCRLHNDWLTAFNSSSSISETLFKSHQINLLDTFNPGDLIMIRFRLFADGYVNGWGWVIDDLEIQDRLVRVENEINNIPKEYSLAQNYPNPFNPTTTIKFSVPCEGAKCIVPVQLKIYDALGKEVRTLVNETKSSGNYEVLFDAADLATGVYYYRLKAGNFTETKKMVLIR
ncbi:MAG: T9SS type A sorting domain-containing protein [Ignavibacteriaceae bacterium]|nr:T9SS type A sorting domain-containing protein [Ignavibacteriaceae bacterium]